jgi:hypothetical protein
MRAIFCAFLIIILAGCKLLGGGGKGGSPNPTNTQSPPSDGSTVTTPPNNGAGVKSIFISKTISQVSALPSCDDTLEGQAYLILDTIDLKVCQSGNWTTINLKGAKGDTGNQGVAGPMGPQGPNGAAASPNTDAVDYDFIDYTYQNNITTSNYYLNGNKIRTCHSKTTSTFYLKNGSESSGYMNNYLNWGDSGCYSVFQSTIGCYSGYKLANNICIKDFESLGTMPTCTFQQSTNLNGTCSDLQFTDVSGNLCGVYDKPLRIKAGLHYVTCDVTFFHRIIIEPGAELRFDDAWEWFSSAGVQAIGSEGYPIKFTVSTNSPQNSWKTLSFTSNELPAVNPKYELQYAMNSFKYIQLSTKSGAMSSANTTFTNAFINYATIAVPSHKVTLSHSMMWNSSISSTIRPTYSDIFRSTGNGGLVSVGDGTMMFWNSGLSLQFTTYYSAPSIIAYNVIPNLQCGTSSITSQMLYGNIYSSNGCASYVTGSNNTTNTYPMTSLPLLFNLGATNMTVKAQQELPILRILALDKNDFLTAPTIHWRANYTFDGSTNLYPTEWNTDTLPSITINTAEYYKLTPTSVNSDAFMNAFTINVLVNHDPNSGY